MKETFTDIKDGYGFEEIPQKVDGIYCDGCLVSHKRPTKMYANAHENHPSLQIMCKSAILRFYGNTSE